MALNGEGSEIRYRHDGPVLWREGREEFLAGESFDRVAQVAGERLREAWAEGQKTRRS